MSDSEGTTAAARRGPVSRATIQNLQSQLDALRLLIGAPQPGAATNLHIPPYGSEPPNYGSFQEFAERFVLVARACQWPAMQRACILPTYLEGRALDCYRELPKAIQADFDTLVSELEEKLQLPGIEKQSAMKMKYRRMKPKESLESYASDIKKLARRAYPRMDEETRDSVALDHFLFGLTPDLQDKLIDRDFNSLEECLTVAQRIVMKRQLMEEEENQAGKQVKTLQLQVEELTDLVKAQSERRPRSAEFSYRQTGRPSGSNFSRERNFRSRRSEPHWRNDHRRPQENNSESYHSPRGPPSYHRTAERPLWDPRPAAVWAANGKQRCHSCGRLGHLSRDCYSNRARDRPDQNRRNQNESFRPENRGAASRENSSPFFAPSRERPARVMFHECFEQQESEAIEEHENRNMPAWEEEALKQLVASITLIEKAREMESPLPGFGDPNADSLTMSIIRRFGGGSDTDEYDGDTEDEGEKKSGLTLPKRDSSSEGIHPSHVTFASEEDSEELSEGQLFPLTDCQEKAILRHESAAQERAVIAAKTEPRVLCWAAQDEILMPEIGHQLPLADRAKLIALPLPVAQSDLAIAVAVSAQSIIAVKGKQEDSNPSGGRQKSVIPPPLSPKLRINERRRGSEGSVGKGHSVQLLSPSVTSHGMRESQKVHIANGEMRITGTQAKVRGREKFERSRSASPRIAFPWILLTILCVIYPLVPNVEATQPMICQDRAGGSVLRIGNPPTCAHKTSIEGKPRNRTLRLYKQNLLQYQSPGFHCVIKQTTIWKLIYFFRNERMQKQKTRFLEVSETECRKMWEDKKCKFGKLEPVGDGYATKNPDNSAFRWCCRWFRYEISQCFASPATIYKRTAIWRWKATQETPHIATTAVEPAC